MPDLRETCQQALESAVKSGAGEVEAYAAETVERSVKIEKNDIHLATSSTTGGLGVRVFREGALGFASTNSLEAADVEAAGAAAVTVARSSRPDDANRLPEAGDLPEVKGLYDSALAETNIGETLEYAKALLGAARDDDSRVTIDGGSVEVISRRQAILNSKGVDAEEVSTHVVYYIMGMARDGEDVSSFQFEFDVLREKAGIDVEKVGRRLAEKVIATLGAGKGESFKGTVLLSPDALMSVLCFPIIFSANAENVQKGRSVFAGKLGQPVADARLTVIDDGLLPGGVATSAFDREGVGHRQLEVISDGVLTGYMYDTRSALRDGKSSTGHAAGGTRSVPGIGPTNMTVKPGEAGKDEIVAGIDRGVLVTRFSGWPDPVSGDFSGVVKGGFLIRDGKLDQPLTGTVIQGNSYEAFKKITAVSSETEQVFSFKLPYVRVEDVSVTSG
ncbi:MAG: TldD/PmbA family protein [Planctomycetota bacterium]|jgi:PmbA protein